MPKAVGNYSVTELEMCSLAINIRSFAQLLKRVDFDAMVDHLVITHIMKSKIEPATNRIRRFPPIVAPPIIRLPLKPPNVKETIANPSLGPDSNLDIEENSPHQEGIITKTYGAPDRSYLEQPTTN